MTPRNGRINPGSSFGGGSEVIFFHYDRASDDPVRIKRVACVPVSNGRLLRPVSRCHTVTGRTKDFSDSFGNLGLGVFVRFFESNDVLLHKTSGSYCVTMVIPREWGGALRSASVRER